MNVAQPKPDLRMPIWQDDKVRIRECGGIIFINFFIHFVRQSLTNSFKEELDLTQL